MMMHNNTLPGIVGLFDYAPEAAKPLRALAQQLLVAESPLSRYEREKIATFTSIVNNCEFCTMSHAGVVLAMTPPITGTTLNDILTALSSASLVIGDLMTVEAMRSLDFLITDRDLSLLRIALHVASKSPIDPTSVAGLKAREIHDAALVTSAFCMYNAYVSSLSEMPPRDENIYVQMGKEIAEKGYL